MEIKENEIYTPEETKTFLKISQSTMRRLIKSGILKAGKVGGQYRILGKNILHLLSPALEEGVAKVYQKGRSISKKIVEKIDE